MRVLMSLCVLLSACASHSVRCDGRLQPINNPNGGGAAMVTPRSVP